MSPTLGVPGSSPWEQFALRNKFGNMGTHLHIESKQARRRRLKLTVKVPRRKTKKKPTSVKTLLQSHFVESSLSIKDAEAFADPMGRKPSQTFRIGFQNINLLPTSARHYKSRQLANHIREADYDIWMMNEIGLYWPKIDAPRSMGGTHLWLAPG